MGVRTSAAGNASTTHYYLTSYAGPAADIAGWVRGQGGIENGLHWVLDVVLREDDSLVRAGHAASDLAVPRRVAVALLKRALGPGTTPTKRLKAGWDENHLLQVLQGIPAHIVR
jgi:predicted transposase YbfD/YdcC